MKPSACGKKALRRRYVGIFSLLAAYILLLAWMISDALPRLLDGGFAFELTLLLSFLLGFLPTLTFALISAERRVSEELEISREISANAAELLAVLDRDKDGVLSRYDLEGAGILVERQGVSKRVLNYLRGSMPGIGHEVQRHVYVIGLTDLRRLDARCRTRFQGWL